jgi:pyruvate formate lyase activating enzyme
MGYDVKLDTNGYLPEVLESLIDRGAVHYVAMDVKAPLEDYATAAGVEVDVSRICRSIDLLREGRVAYEFRTTVVPGSLGNDEIVRIARLIAGAERYYLQQFVPQNTLDPKMMERIPYLPDRLRELAELTRPWVDHVDVRGI